MSNYQGSYALLVNNTLLKEAGLTTDDLATYDSFEATLKKLKKDTNGDGIVDRWGWTWSGSGSQNPWTSMELAIYAFGGRLIKNLHMNSNVPEPVIIDSPETVKALTWMTNVYKNGLVPQSVPTDTYELSMEQFMTGQVATLQEGPWSLSSEKEAFAKKGWELASAALPKGPAGSASFISFGDFGIFNTAQRRGTVDACLTWLKFFTGEEGERIWCQMLGRIPNRPEIQKEPFWTDDVAFKGFIAASATADREQPIWMTGLNRTINDEVVPMFQGMLLGKISPEDTSKQLQDILVKGLTSFGVKLPTK
ncbi:MAG: extracellular solute-binding protein [Candidatus Atribacteria bacterium]|nr:extracellular solute-binding protein [Candidatus Atribacteria bacterium]